MGVLVAYWACRCIFDKSGHFACSFLLALTLLLVHYKVLDLVYIELPAYVAHLDYASEVRIEDCFGDCDDLRFGLEDVRIVGYLVLYVWIGDYYVEGLHVLLDYDLLRI